MEIPYLVTPRKDTGLFNSKIAIWLFLASEVMLFGGFFSAYVFLRIGADYPWPERTLPVLPGLINTFVLIGSSVTVVFAWASLKLGQWRNFQIYMGITVFCALVFMVLKGIEYNGKLHHQALRLSDYSIVEGHLGYADEPNHKGKKVEENVIFINASELNFSSVRFHAPWVEDLLAQAVHRGSKIVLAEDIVGITEQGEPSEVLAKAGDPLSVKLLKTIKEVHLKARSHNVAYRTEALRQEWKQAKATGGDTPDWQLASGVNIDVEALRPKLLDEVPNVGFKVEPPVRLEFRPRDIKEAKDSSRLRDDTVVVGELLESPMVFHNVDAIDFQFLAMRAEERGIDPEVAIQNSWLMKNYPFAREAWEWHQGEVSKLRAKLVEGYKLDKDGNPNRVPTHKELYRIGWKDLAKMAEDGGREKLSMTDGIKEEFFGPDYQARGEETFPPLTVPREQVGFAAKFTPAWNTYYALYFTMTGLHGLHVIGGALVLAYYLFFGRAMFLSNPEWLANRVEIAGLFWHFVDLVWIFVFPIFYLM